MLTTIFGHKNIRFLRFAKIAGKIWIIPIKHLLNPSKIFAQKEQPWLEQYAPMLYEQSQLQKGVDILINFAFWHCLCYLCCGLVAEVVVCFPRIGFSNFVIRIFCVICEVVQIHVVLHGLCVSFVLGVDPEDFWEALLDQLRTAIRYCWLDSVGSVAFRNPKAEISKAEHTKDGY